jgi:hypothetical protein
MVMLRASAKMEVKLLREESANGLRSGSMKRGGRMLAIRRRITDNVPEGGGLRGKREEGR